MMGLKIIQPLCKLCKEVNIYRPLRFGVSRPVLPSESTLKTAENVIEKTFNKSEILTKYSVEQGFNPNDVMNDFSKLEKLITKQSSEHLLKLTEDGKVILYEKPTTRLVKKRFLILKSAAEEKKEEAILSFFKEKCVGVEAPTNQELGKILDNLLVLEKEGKIPPHEISRLLTSRQYTNPDDFKLLLKYISEGKINENNLVQAKLLAENAHSLNLLNAKTIDDLTHNELRDLSNILASKSTNAKKAVGEALQKYKNKICELNTEILPSDLNKRTELLKEVIKKLTADVNVNSVNPETYSKFLKDFEGISNVFKNSKYTIDDLAKSGGIKLEYSRDAFKTNVLKQLEELPFNEQNKILHKFGLNKVSENSLSGLPVSMKNTDSLTQVEKNINSEIEKFLKNNKIILPKGFEEFQAPMDDICKTFPEFKYAIGSIQHGTHTKDLASHMLMAFQENLRNPLYATLSAADKRILGISTLLHDINKIEKTVDALHPATSSKTVKSIVNNMETLTNAEKNRIINFVENHHWLQKIQNGKDFDSAIADDLAYKFRKGNDFTMAKIFAESDLKAVNNEFYSSYGSKINSDCAKAIEERIIKIQSRGKLIYTTDVSLQKAIAKGAHKVTIGTGSEATENYVIKAKDFGLDKENVLYHAPGKSDAYILAQSGLGYGNNGVFSCSLGRVGHTKTFQNRNDFIIFKKPDMGNISLASMTNADSGANKTYETAKNFIMSNKAENPILKMYNQSASKQLSEAKYAKIYRIASDPHFKLEDIHSNPQIQKILGGEKESKLFEECVKKQNELYVSSDKSVKGANVPELVCHDLEGAAIGTNTKAEDIPYQARKLYPLIIEF